MDNILGIDVAVTPIAAPGLGVAPAPLNSGAPASGPIQDPYQGDGTPAVGAPGIITPGAALRTSHYPVTLVRDAGEQPISPGDNLLADQFRPTAPGLVRIAGALQDAATFTVSLDGGVSAYTLNGGANLTAGAWFETQVTVAPGDQLVVSVSAQTTVQGFRAVYVPDVL